MIGVAQKPLVEPTIPYVPPLANTFSHNSTVLAPDAVPMGQMPPMPKLSDAEIIGGISNVKLNADQQQQPLINLAPVESPATQPVPGQLETNQQPLVPVQAAAVAPVPTSQSFAAIPPTSVASLNESFGIATTGMNSNYYQAAVSSAGQGKHEPPEPKLHPE